MDSAAATILDYNRGQHFIEDSDYLRI